MNVCMYDRNACEYPCTLSIHGGRMLYLTENSMCKYKVSLKPTFPFEALPGDSSGM
jgi:hypothetical protein